mgnify:CR=1 FL=1
MLSGILQKAQKADETSKDDTAVSLSVVIVTYNRCEKLKECLSSLLKQSLTEFEIIIVDDGSTDNTQETVLSFKDKRFCYHRKRHSGCGESRNIGLNLARGRIIAFTDDDCIPETEWAKKIIESHIRNPDATCIGGAVINPYDDSVGWAGYLLEFSAWLPTGKPRAIYDVPTANASYKKKRISGFAFNALFKHNGFEDSIFNLGLRSAGHTLLFDPDIMVEHYHNRTSMNALLELQKGRAKDFVRGGYKAYGFKGKLLLRFPMLNLLCLDVPTVFLRSIRAGFIREFIIGSLRLVWASHFRGKEILKNIGNPKNPENPERASQVETQHKKL